MSCCISLLIYTLSGMEIEKNKNIWFIHQRIFFFTKFKLTTQEQLKLSGLSSILLFLILWRDIYSCLTTFLSYFPNSRIHAPNPHFRLKGIQQKQCLDCHSEKSIDIIQQVLTNFTHHSILTAIVACTKVHICWTNFIGCNIQHISQ